MTKTIFAACAALAMAGCAHNPERIAMRQEAERTTPTCDGERDCTAKWDAAQLWVAKNAGYKIQTVTGVLIQTHNPGPHDVYLAASVTKEPLGGGRFKIVSRMWCNNMFGCRPDPLDAVLRFNRDVSAAAP